ncbi:hypothetical protein VNI00_013944 [Paramarasmius palmivorus]|uniref:Uncharacterized protein n=1 Tax=Paramarasmius palmivorus TaxID=297713 RepID=A0AAW0BXQ0_9AGAR
MGGFALYNGDKFLGYLQHRGGVVDEQYWPEIKERYQKIMQERSIPAKSEMAANPSPMIAEQEVAPTGKPLSQNSNCESGHNLPEPPTCLLEYLVEIGQITISESEINDRSRGDFVTKSIAVVQTTWFVAQVIARAIQGLAITELEIITVGFTILTLGTCIAWWSKPLRVRYPLRIDCGEQGYARKQPITFWGLLSPGFEKGLKEYWVNVYKMHHEWFTCKSEPQADDSHPGDNQADQSDLESAPRANLVLKKWHPQSGQLYDMFLKGCWSYSAMLW